MYILAIDTATNAGGLALGRNAELIAQWMSKSPLSYSENLISSLEFLLRQEKLTLPDVGCFAVSTGPGSFTGLRIGLSAVKAFGQVLDLPIAGVSTLEALAFRFRHVSPLVATMIDARRQQIYGAVYRTDEAGCELVCTESVARPEQWLRSLAENLGDVSRQLVFVGDGALLYRSTVQAVFPDARLLETDNCILRELVHLAHLRVKNGRGVSALELKGNYLRPPDAELPKARNQA